jgi:plastocyanin domain-containing protein
MEVTADGFKPDNLSLKANQPVKFVVKRTSDETCATDLLIEGTDIKVALPLNTAVEVAWTPTKAGKVKFGCAMDFMVSGVLVVE